MSRYSDQIIDDFENWTDGQIVDYLFDEQIDEPDFEDCESEE